MSDTRNTEELEAIKNTLAWSQSRDAVGRAGMRAATIAESLAVRLEAVEDALQRTVYIAEHLFEMVPQQAWRDSGGDDGQGHYEGDYHAEKLQEELKELATLAGGRIRDSLLIDKEITSA